MKIQQQYRKKIIVFTFFSLALLVGAKENYAQKAQNSLKSADSLFANKQYTESYKIYEHIYKNEKKASPAMLLRMAFIQEGLGEYSQALYFLSEYYLLTSDDTVVEKISKLSAEHNLRGYEFTDTELIQSFFKKNQYVFIYSLLFIALVGLSYFLFFRKNQLEKPYGLGVAYVLILSLLFYLVNFPLTNDHAIITENNTFIMSGPSAGADVLNVSNKGHRVKIAGQEDIWTKVEWNGEIAFIREDNLRILRQ
ncbi:hypothetical protein PZB74_04330 [Porifericola rhodea]|uniref:hypothetical protein n=1 Tax=Porifericola rhodea TaxID=930972 RepID=UPI0026669953|nr:hypothetical protein [Porifericola rhodea]WKN32570.1 hypothetical protein PZB74_04330 [Porifericola rhodea]